MFQNNTCRERLHRLWWARMGPHEGTVAVAPRQGRACAVTMWLCDVAGR